MYLAIVAFLKFVKHSWWSFSIKLYLPSKPGTSFVVFHQCLHTLLGLSWAVFFWSLDKLTLNKTILFLFKINKIFNLVIILVLKKTTKIQNSMNCHLVFVTINVCHYTLTFFLNFACFRINLIHQKISIQIHEIIQSKIKM